MSLDTWQLVNTRHDTHSLGQHNSVFTIANGYMGLKGNLQEDRDGYCPVTIINGVYDELDMFSQIRASNEKRRYLDERLFDTAGKSPAVANLPNPLAVRVFVEGTEISFTRGSIGEFRQMLSLRDGLYSYSFIHTDASGRATRLEMTRFASIEHAHRAYMRYAVTPLNHDSRIRILSGIDGATFSNTTRERQFRVASATAGPGWTELHAHTPARGLDVQMRTTERLTGAEPAAESLVEHDAAWSVAAFEARQGQSVCLERSIVATCSEDARHGVSIDLQAEATAAARAGFDQAAAEQAAAWAKIWDRCDVRIDGDDEAQRDLRFCIYHVMAAAPRYSPQLSVPVKLLSGEYYQGNTFYDTDIYILPLLTFTMPDLAQRCLRWRCVGIEPGRQAARERGHKGTKLAWQAGPYGEECLGNWWRFIHTNIHINADAVYALMQYWQASGDDVFMAEAGIDLLVETARFYASRADYDAGRDRYSLRDVAGPDEGHCESTDNFYTNYLAGWNLRWAARMIGWLGQHDPQAFDKARGRLAIEPDEPKQWEHVADRLTFLFDPATKVYEQCEGFYQLEPLPPELSPERKVWFATVAPYQALNQPDVLMAMAMFRDAFAQDVRRANWEFYHPKSMNFSSMSFVINSIMSGDVGAMEKAYREFRVCAGVDIDESLTGRKDTFAGLHGTALGGAWMATVFGFAGVRLHEDELRIDPQLPPHWKQLRFKLALAGGMADVGVTPSQLTIQVDNDVRSAIRARVKGRPIVLEAGQKWQG